MQNELGIPEDKFSQCNINEHELTNSDEPFNKIHGVAPSYVRV